MTPHKASKPLLICSLYITYLDEEIEEREILGRATGIVLERRRG